MNQKKKNLLIKDFITDLANIGTYQKEMHNISSAKSKHGIHRIMRCHKVPGQQWYTGRIHLSEEKAKKIHHGKWAKRQREN